MADEVRDFLDEVEVIRVGRYARRWATRLREYGFTREDAAVFSLGTFGTDLAGGRQRLRSQSSPATVPPTVSQPAKTGCRGMAFQTGQERQLVSLY